MTAALTRECDGCGKFRPIRDYLDGDSLCQECCDKWARAEGQAQHDDARPEAA